MRCLTDAWNTHEVELRRFLRHRARSEAEGDDLLQGVFLRAMRQPKVGLYANGRRIASADFQYCAKRPCWPIESQAPLPDKRQ